MNAVVDAAVDAADAATDAGRLVIVPAVARTSQNGQMRIATYTNPTPHDVDTSSPPNEPYCVAIPSEEHPGGGVRWATCAAGESAVACIRDASCPEYVTAERALGCGLDGTSTRPTCAPLQYDVAERCRACDASAADKVCVIRPTGETACVDNISPGAGLDDGPVCQRDTGGNVMVGVILNGTFMPNTEPSVPASVCSPGADCYFQTGSLDARCAPVAPQLPRYPIRGCGAVGEELECRASAIGYESTGNFQKCAASRDNQGTPWGPWRTGAPCAVGTLCDFVTADMFPVCTTLPSWLFGTEPNQVCGDCVGVPCYVYEDGSHECMHKPTRTEDATRTRSDSVGCCRRSPSGAGFEPGECSAQDGFAFPGTPEECPSNGSCFFTPAGVAECG